MQPGAECTIRGRRPLSPFPPVENSYDVWKEERQWHSAILPIFKKTHDIPENWKDKEGDTEYAGKLPRRQVTCPVSQLVRGLELDDQCVEGALRQRSLRYRHFVVHKNEDAVKLGIVLEQYNRCNAALSAHLN